MFASVRNMMILGLAAVALVDPAAADGSRMRRPRGDRPADPIRERRDRRSRGVRPVDPPRMRDGMYGDEAGAYGDVAGAYGEDMMEETCSTSLLDAVAATPDLSTLGAAVAAAGLEGALNDPATALTVLAPANSAFAAIDADTLASLLEQPEVLAGILTLHVIDGAVFAGDLTDGMVVTTLSGGELTVGVSDEGVTFTAPSGVVATVSAADIDVCSSVVHVIDAVLLP